MMMQPHRPIPLNTSPSQRRILIIILIQRIHAILLVVQMVKQDPNQASRNKAAHGEPNKHPLDSRIVQDGVQSLGDGGPKRVSQQIHCLDEGLHAGWRFGVSVFEACH